MHFPTGWSSMPEGRFAPQAYRYLFFEEGPLLQFWVRFHPNPQSETTMQRTTRLLAAATLLALSAGAHAQVNQVRVWAAACANCHGTDGKALDRSVVPTLAGMPRDNFIAQMKDFRGANTRKATVMHQIAKGYTDVQIEALASWFAAQKR